MTPEIRLSKLKLLLKVTLSAGLIWFAFSNVDVGAATTHLRGIPIAAIAAALALLLLGHFVAALRLRRLIGLLGGGCTRTVAFDIVLIGAFFGQAFISFVSGDAMRTWRMVQAKFPFGLAVRGVVSDRLAGFCGLIAIILVSLPRLLDVISHPAIKAGLVTALLAAIAGILALFLTRRMPAALRRKKVFRWIADISRFADAIFQSNTGLLLLIAMSAGIHLLNVLAIYVISRGLEMDISLMTLVVLFPPVLLLSLVPISVAGWGVREGATVVALNLVGVPSDQSLALSICFGLCALTISLPGGVLWLISRGRPRAGDGANRRAPTPKS